MFGQTRSLLRVSELRMIREEALLTAMRKNLAAETAHIWFELEGLRESLRINEEMQESWEESLLLSRVLLQEGRVAPIDVARVEVELMSVAAERPAILAAIKQRENLLAVLSGKPPSLFEVPEAGANTIHPVHFHIPNPDDWVNQRPDLLAVEALARAAALDVDAVKSRFLPMLSIEGMLGYAAGSLSGLGSASSSTWFLSPVVSFPIFDRLRIAAGLELKEAQQQEILLLWQDHVNKATAEVEYALENVIQGKNELQFYENRRDAASAVLQTGRVRYAAGSSDLIELLDLQRSLHSAEMALSQSHTRQRQALVKLHLALGSSLGNAES
jgi:outer membrane protein TolC